MIREELALVKQNGAWKPRRKKGWSGLFYPSNGLNFQFCWFNSIFLTAPRWSKSNFILLLFFYSIRVDPSRSELIWPGLAVRVDLVRLLYLPLIYMHLHIFTTNKISHFTVANRIIKYFLFLLLYRQQMVLQKVRSKSKVVLHKYPPYAPFNWNPSPLTPWSPWS